MPVLHLITEIKAPIQRVFDLARSIDLHKTTAKHTNEIVVAGRSYGLIKLNESVTWRAKHFGIYQNLTSRITEMTAPNSFTDEMMEGAFNKIVHNHIFLELSQETTLMEDRFEFRVPGGLIGKIFSRLVLKKYLQSFLQQRNQRIKEIAEGNEWQIYISE